MKRQNETKNHRDTKQQQTTWNKKNENEDFKKIEESV